MCQLVAVFENCDIIIFFIKQLHNVNTLEKLQFSCIKILYIELLIMRLLFLF